MSQQQQNFSPLATLADPEMEVHIPTDEVVSVHIPVSAPQEAELVEPSPRHRKNAAAAAAAASPSATASKYLAQQAPPRMQSHTPQQRMQQAPPTPSQSAFLFPGGATPSNQYQHSPSPSPSPQRFLYVDPATPAGASAPSIHAIQYSAPVVPLGPGPVTVVQPFNTPLSPSPPPRSDPSVMGSAPPPPVPTPPPPPAAGPGANAGAGGGAGAGAVQSRPTLARTNSILSDTRMQDLSLPAPLLKRVASIDPELAKKAAAREALRPDVSKAERYRNLTCPRVRDTSKGTYSLYSIWKFTDREFLQFGLGVMLWFKLVRRLAWLFLVLFLINLPAIVLNVAGPDSDGSSTSASSAPSLEVAAAAAAGSNATLLFSAQQQHGTFGLAKITLGNQGLALNATIMGYPKQHVGVLMGALDTFACVVFILATSWIFWDHRKQAATYNSSVMTVRRFTVLVTGLPQAEPLLSRTQIADFFEARFGPVVDVSIAYNDVALIQLFKARGELRREMLNAEALGDLETLARLRTRLKDADTTLAFKRRIHRRQIRAAFVTFQTQESVSRCVAAYPKGWWSRCLMPRHLRWGGVTPLRVDRAAEPSNTLFHNLGLSYGDKWCRRAWTGLVSLVFMSVSFVAVFVSQYYQNEIPSTDFCAAQAVLDRGQVTDTQSRFCYCGSLSTSDLYSSSGYCQEYIVQYSLSQGLIFLTACSTVLVNALLQVFMDKLAVLERHSSVTSQQRGITSRLFWGLFFNTGVIILLVNADFSPYVGTIPWSSWLLPGQYADFTPDWCGKVGVSIMITMFLNTQNPHLLSLLAIPYDSCRRKQCRRWSSTQNELNTLFQGRRFVLFERYSVLLNTAYVCCLFSSGMPILWLVAAFTFFLTYWFDKTTFLRSYRIPPRYDESLDSYSAAVLPYAVVPHLLLALWFYSSPMTASFPLGDAISFVSNSGSDGPLRSGTFSLRERLLQWNTFPAFLLLLLIGGSFLARRALAFIFFCSASEAEQRDDRLGREEKKSKSRSVTYEQACAKVGLESYRMSRQHEYRAAYIVTDSKKQLPLEMELQEQRQWEADARRGKRRSKHKSPAAAPAVVKAKLPGSSASPASKYSVASPTESPVRGGSSLVSHGTSASANASAAAVHVAWGPGASKTQAPASTSSLASHRPSAIVTIGGGGHHRAPQGSFSAHPAQPQSPSGEEPHSAPGGAGPRGHHRHALSTSLVAPLTPQTSHRPSVSVAAHGPAGSLGASSGTEQFRPVPTGALGAQPVASFADSSAVSDAVVLGMAAAVSNPTSSPAAMGYTLLPISCPSCANLFQIVDCGEAMSYTCPFCSAQTII